MEGWRQERLGSRAGTHREKEKNKNILTGKERKKNTLDTHRPSHGRVNIAVLAPIPSARESTATVVKPRFLPRTRAV
jgi:hypothetical protein